jgi:hypothetical protein
MLIRVPNRSHNQRPRLTANPFSGKAWERIQEAKESKPLSFVSLFFVSTFFNLLFPGIVAAQNAQNVNLSPRFSPNPLILQGTSNGLIPISQVAGRQDTENGPCVGFTQSQPDHTLVLTSRFNSLSIQVQSAEDTTLLVRGPGGTWCNDDAQGKNPGLMGQWLPGTYRIWVGSYQKGQSRPYTLRITEPR